MEKFGFEFSLKNIPIPSRLYFSKLLIAKTSDFIERLRWKVFFHLNPDAKRKEVPESYGFNTARSAPKSNEVTDFENAVFDLVTNVEYRESPKSNFQKNLDKKVQEINKSDKAFLLADKTTNIYKVSPKEYTKLLTENVAKDYKKSSTKCVDKVNKDAKKLAEKLKLEERIEVHSEDTAFITLKDHKPDFRDNPKCRLINPAKSQIGRVSKQILEKLNNEIRDKSELKQWRSTSDVLSWFKDLKNKADLRFLQLDIVEFYPSISQRLLEDALKFAEETIGRRIEQKAKDIILNARQAFLFTENGGDSNAETQPWMKISGSFDVTMGAPDGAEVCELVGLFILSELRKHIPELEFGLYRDDGLAIHKVLTNRNLENINKKLHNLFKEHGLRITIETSCTKVNFLDVSLDLTNGGFCPYKKPNSKPLYVHNLSNHPKTVIKQIPLSINNRLKKISSSKEAFNTAKGEYQQSLYASGYNHKLHFNDLVERENITDNQETSVKRVYEDNEVSDNVDEDETSLKTVNEDTSSDIESEQTEPKGVHNDNEDTKKKRKRDIIWFNPPYNSEVSTNIGKKFLELIDQHFPKHHKLRKCINRNCIKVSYSCTKNIRSIIQSHNKKIVKKEKEKEKEEPRTTVKKTCNCRDQRSCPLNGQCLESVVYRAELETEQGSKVTYIGSSNNFKNRFRNHTKSFRNRQYKHETTLSKYIWDNNLGPEPNVKWSVVSKAFPYKAGQRYCDMCVTEKHFISQEIRKPWTCLNARSDLTNRCVHKTNFKLKRV